MHKIVNVMWVVVGITALVFFVMTTSNPIRRNMIEFTSSINGKRISFKKESITVVYEGAVATIEGKSIPPITHITLFSGDPYPVKDSYDKVIKAIK